jgi:hypothetical protein
MTMRLSLFFLAMDMLTLLVYPVLFVQGKLRQLVKAKESILLANSLPAVLVVLDS